VKEPLLKDEQIIVGSRAVVATEFTERGRFDATTSIPPRSPPHDCLPTA
jgi:hypothetical protein